MTLTLLGSPEGVTAIFADAHGGQAGAMRMAAICRSAGIYCEQDWYQGLSWLTLAARNGDLVAQDELLVLSHDEALVGQVAARLGGGEVVPPDTWNGICEAIDLSRLVRPPEGTRLVVSDPILGTLELMASPATCAWLVRRAAPNLSTARVYLDGREGIHSDPNRTNSAATIDLVTGGLPILALRERIAVLLGVGTAQLEPSQLLRYEPGQTYTDHFDAFDDSVTSKAEMATSGQRIATLLVSLNADYQGGETAFPTLEATYRGAVGQAIFWSNADASGRRDQRTLHAGTPPTSGTKWMLSQWVREREYRG